ncbi:MAG: mechanosensitive ion channel family protein [Chlamydiae bacterium]|jgi:small-conductance mechanosensitive channel|nr:mechanosensitive ion channel family protein [Chlamydiota bacterium]
MEDWLLKNGVITLVGLGFILTARTLIARFVRGHSELTTQQKLRSLNYLKSGAIIGFSFLILLVWGKQLHGFAVSVFAIAFAMVFTIKESLTCINGAFLRWQGNSYQVGDRISIKDYRGDVIDISLLTTTIMEVGKISNNPITSGANHHATGKKIVFPNSLLLTETITNESYLGYYQIIDFSFALSRDENWRVGEKLLCKIVSEECAPFIEQAKNKIKQLEKIRSVDLPQIEPKVRVSLAEKEVVRIYVRCPAPNYQKEKIEQAITERFIHEFYHEPIKDEMIILPDVDLKISG